MSSPTPSPNPLNPTSTRAGLGFIATSRDDGCEDRVQGLEVRNSGLEFRVVAMMMMMMTLVSGGGGVNDGRTQAIPGIVTLR